MNAKLVGTLAVIVALLSGCSTQRTAPQSWLGAPAEVRGQLGTVGVQIDSTRSRNFVWEEPDGKSRASRDMAGAGLGLNLLAAAQSEKAGGFVLVLLPAFVAGGAVYGGVTGVSADKLNQSLKAVAAASAECDLAAQLPETVTRLAWSRGLDVVDASTGQTNYDSLLVLRVVTQQLTAGRDESPNPSLLLHYLVQARLMDSKGKVLYDTYVETKSPRRDFVEWAENKALRLRNESARRQSDLAEKIVDRVFLGKDSE